MERGHARVPGLHGLEHNGALFSSYFSNNNFVGPLPQGSPEQVEHGDRRPAIVARFSSNDFPYPIWVGHYQLGGVFDADNLGVGV